MKLLVLLFCFVMMLAGAVFGAAVFLGGYIGALGIIVLASIIIILIKFMYDDMLQQHVDYERDTFVVQPFVVEPRTFDIQEVPSTEQEKN